MKATFLCRCCVCAAAAGMLGPPPSQASSPRQRSIQCSVVLVASVKLVVYTLAGPYRLHQSGATIDF